MNIDKLTQELEETKSEINILMRKQSSIAGQIAVLKSQKFIFENSITRYQVQCSEGGNIPFFNTIYQFGHWLRDNSNKPWCCFNGTLYKSQEIIEGRMDRNAVGRYKDLIL